MRAAFLAAALRAFALRLRVAAAFLPAALRLAVDWLLPPLRPPFFADALLVFLPRPEPDFLPPPLDFFRVAQARASAVFFYTPRRSYPSSMCSA